MTRALHTVLTLGLNLVAERIPPRWRYAALALVIANEIRGIAVVYGLIELAI